MDRKICTGEEIALKIFLRLAEEGVPEPVRKRIFVMPMELPLHRTDANGCNWRLADQLSPTRHPFADEIQRAVEATQAECNLKLPFLGATARALR